MPEPTDQDLEDLALQLAAEAVAALPAIATDEQRQRIEAKIVLELVGTPAGRLRLRRCFDDPAYNRSGPRSTEDEATATKGKEGKGS